MQHYYLGISSLAIHGSLMSGTAYQEFPAYSYSTSHFSKSFYTTVTGASTGMLGIMGTGVPGKMG